MNWKAFWNFLGGCAFGGCWLIGVNWICSHPPTYTWGLVLLAYLSITGSLAYGWASKE